MHKPNDYYTHLFANSQPCVPALGLMKFASKPTKGVFSEKGEPQGLACSPHPGNRSLDKEGPR